MFDAREKRVEIYRDTMKQCTENPFLKNAIKASIEGTIIYPSQKEISISALADKAGSVSVTVERSFEAAMNLKTKYPDKKVAVHNFASATNPGGGVERGSNAQEESLCRCSTLYRCLNVNMLWSEYYQFHRQRNDVRYTDTCVYTPGVYIIKSDTDFPQLLPESEWVCVDIITCAAPNLRERPYNSMNPGSGSAIKVSDRELFDIHTSRATQIIKSAVANKVDCLVLGAFGCGAFCNNPAVVARAYKEALKTYCRYFEEIVFAVYCSPKDSSNYNTFREVILARD